MNVIDLECLIASKVTSSDVIIAFLERLDDEINIVSNNQGCSYAKYYRIYKDLHTRLATIQSAMQFVNNSSKLNEMYELYEKIYEIRHMRYQSFCGLCVACKSAPQALANKTLKD